MLRSQPDRQNLGYCNFTIIPELDAEVPMKHLTAIAFVATIILSLTTGVQSQAPPTQKAAPSTEAKKPPTRWKIQNAMSAGPAAIAKNATIMDWPAKEGDEPPVLRKGTNEWTCFPDDPGSPGNDPMCFDKTWMVWADAWMHKKDLKITTAGIAYMLQGGSDASNTDPFATKPAPGEKWINAKPHLMVLVPGKLDPKLYSSDPNSGGPWIMWGGTPYEHLMVPVK